MILRAGLVAVLMCPAGLVWAQEDDSAPLSAIDWLSESVEQPPVAVAAPTPGTQATRVPNANEAPVANSATTPQVSVQALGGPAARALGVLPASATGLSPDIWAQSDADVLSALLMAQEVDTLPAVQDVLLSLALSEANPPRGDVADGFFLSRVDKLLDFGALEQAQAMLEMAVPETPRLYRRWFDVSLLTGTEDAACRSLQRKPEVAPTASARIFCLARSGDWSAAALTLNTGLALGDIDEDTGALLARFLDPELYEGEPDLVPPTRMTPLTFRMFEAIGAPQSTQNLPRAFAHADLRANVGWKAQLEAAERLARAGAVSQNVLIGLYTARVPAASGGVWERARAVAGLNAGLEAGTPDAAILRLWDEARSVGVAVPLAQYYAERLIEAPSGRSDSVRFKLLLLSDAYELAALDDTLAATDPFLAAVARGMPDDALANQMGYPLVRDAFAADPNGDLIEMSAQGRTGEAILRTLAGLQQGIDGDAQAFEEGIATLRALGLEDTARRTALQYLILR